MRRWLRSNLHHCHILLFLSAAEPSAAAPSSTFAARILTLQTRAKEIEEGQGGGGKKCGRKESSFLRRLLFLLFLHVYVRRTERDRESAGSFVLTQWTTSLTFLLFFFYSVLSRETQRRELPPRLGSFLCRRCCCWHVAFPLSFLRIRFAGYLFFSFFQYCACIRTQREH